MELMEMSLFDYIVKYGIIKDGDMYEKQEEFLAWLTEVKGVSQEACGQREMKEHFSTFCEDYNTATLPSEKYYNLKAWYVKDQNRKAAEEQQAALEAADRQALGLNAPPDGLYFAGATYS